MRVRRAAATGAVAVLVLLGGSAWADETPAPGPTSTAGDGVLDPAGNPDCFVVPEATDEPTAEVTDEPPVEVTDEPTPDASVEATPEATDGATPEATDEPTPDATEERTPDATDEATPDPDPTGTPGGQVVCLAYTDGTPESDPTLGGGSAQLPFSGAPVGRYAATGLALVLAGAASVLLARRRSA